MTVANRGLGKRVRGALEGQRSRLGLAVVLLLGLVWLGSCDDTIAPVPPKQGNEPPETFLLVEGDSLAPQLYRVQLSWLGSDTDGSVVSFRWRWRCPAGTAACLVDTAWSETQERAQLFVLPVPEGTAQYIFQVAAVDDDGQADVEPATQSFELRNASPSVGFVSGTLPQQSLPAVTFYLQAADPDTTPKEDDGDSPGYLGYYVAWLDGAEDTPEVVPIEENAVTLELQDFDGRYEARTFFVRAVDEGGATSAVVQHTWTVQEPPQQGILLVDDCRMGGFIEGFSDQSYRNVLTADAPGRFVVLDIETVPRLSAKDLEATLDLFDRVVWYTDADTTSSGALELARGGLEELLARNGRLFLSSGLVFGTHGAFGDREAVFRDLFGIETVYRAPDGGTNFAITLDDTVQAAVHPGLTEFWFLSFGLRAIMECFASRQDATTRSLYFYPESTFVRQYSDSTFTNPVQFDIGVHHELGPTGRATYVSFPIGIPINANAGENETEIREILKLTQILEP